MTAIAQTKWPDVPSAGLIGDGRAALASYRPEDVEPLCQLVREQVALGHAIYPQGGCTSLEYGDVPRRPGVIVNTQGLNRLIDYPFADMTITVQAGMTLSALRGILAEKHQRVLVDAPHPEQATIGGIYATNTTGPRRFAAGRPRDQIIGVSFVTSNGEVIKGGGRVVKNVAGYDLPKLLTGSMGTLGIITQLTVKVRPIPETSAIMWAPFTDLSRLATVLDDLNLSGTRPMALELLNRPAAEAVGQSFGLPSSQAVLVVGLEDNAASIGWQIDRLKSEVGQPDQVIVEGEQVDPIWDRLTEFQAATPGPLSFVANIRPSSVAAFVAELDPARWWVQAHAGNGIIRGHGLGDWTLESATHQIESLRRKAVADGGNLTISRCPTDWKSRLHVWGEPRADWAIAERVRAALDPHAAMNPGRFIPNGA